MSGGFDLNKLMQQASQMQQQMEQAREELAEEIVEASAGGGIVTVKATGAGEITEVKIAKEAIDPDDPEMLEDTIVAAVNEALRAAENLAQTKLGGAMGGLDLPPGSAYPASRSQRFSRMIGVRGAAGVEAVDVHLGAADHEVHVRGGDVDPALGELVRRQALAPLRPRRCTRCRRRCGTPRSRPAGRCRRRGRGCACVSSTSATSPRNAAPSSDAICERTKSAPSSAPTFTARPSRNSTSSPGTV